MRQAVLNHSFSQAADLSVVAVKRLGFLIADPSQPVRDPEAEHLGPHVIDWDELDASQEAPDAEPFFAFARS